MRQSGVHVPGHHVRLGLIAENVRGRPPVVDGVQQVEELRGLVPASEPRQGHHDPNGRVRVLPAILPDARRVPLDVAGVLRGSIEWRIEQQQHLRPPRYEKCPDRIHRALGKSERDGVRQDGPRLRDGVDAALIVLRRSQRRTVIVVPPSVPLTIP
jgi:hypothetical protein